MTSIRPKVVAARRVLAWAALASAASGLIAAAISSRYPHAVRPPHALDPGAPRFVAWLEQWLGLSLSCSLVAAVLSVPRWQSLVAILVLAMTAVLMLR